MYTLEDNISGMFTEERQYIRNRRLIGKTPQSNTVTVRAAGN